MRGKFSILRKNDSVYQKLLCLINYYQHGGGGGGGISPRNESAQETRAVCLFCIQTAKPNNLAVHFDPF
jgi:hypothetical protein